MPIRARHPADVHSLSPESFSKSFTRVERRTRSCGTRKNAQTGKEGVRGGETGKWTHDLGQEAQCQHWSKQLPFYGAQLEPILSETHIKQIERNIVMLNVKNVVLF